MNAPSTIRLLAAENNERGDLFTRLVKDLFFAQGYDNLRFDVHKSLQLDAKPSVNPTANS